MGYCITQTAGQFRIKADNKSAALAAIKGMAGQGTRQDSRGRHFSWVEDADFLDANTLEEALRAWLYDPTTDAESGDIVRLEFDAEKMGDEAEMFRAIAPYVEGGSYLQMLGEDGAQWRWVFDGRTMREIQATISFEGQ